MMQVWKIDKDNIYTGESYFVEDPSKNEITTPITIGYVKPKWSGNEWIEGATEQEIQEWKDSQIIESIELTDEQKRILDLEMAIADILGGGF